MAKEQIDIKEFIPIGKDNSISSGELSDLLGISNRDVRRSIERYRENRHEYVIISSSHCKGYYRTKNKEEIEAFIKEMDNRAKKIFYNTKQARIFASEIGQQYLNLEGKKDESN